MNKFNRSLIIIFIMLLFICVASYSASQLTNKTSALGMNGESFIALNDEALQGTVSHPDRQHYMFFKFTRNQKSHLENLRFKSGSAAVQVLLEKKKSLLPSKDKDPLYELGFLYDKDFKSETEMYSNLDRRPVIKGSWNDLTSSAVSLSLCIERDEKVPAGFFLYGEIPYSIKEATFAPGQIGWSKSFGASKAPLFAAGPLGLVVDASFSSVDFSEGSAIFAMQNSSSSLLPKIEISMEAIDDCGTWREQKSVDLKYGNESIKIRRAKNLPLMVIQTSSLWKPYGQLVFTNNAQMVKSVFLKANDSFLLPSKGRDVLHGLPTDLGLVMDWPMYNWRNKDFELYQWAEFPQVLVFDTADYKIQDKFFTRLSYFVEKVGYKGTFVSDDFIENNHGYNAHDYKADDLARFFSKAAEHRVTLNSYEELLKEILVANKMIIEESDGSYSAGVGAVISFSRESNEKLRLQLVSHESWHGIYFTNEKFRKFTESAYKNFPSKALKYLLAFWTNNPNLMYDVSDDYLVKNEFMAYLMQQSLDDVEKYYLDRTEIPYMQKAVPSLNSYVRSSNAYDFLEASMEFNDYAFKTWGLAAGRISLISRE